MAADPADVLRDPARLAALRETGLTAEPAGDAFRRITRLAARVLSSSFAYVSLVSEDHQLLSSVSGIPGLSGRRVPIDESLCRHAVESRGPLAVVDARTHPPITGLRSLAAVGASAYLAVPLVTPDHHAVGTLCVVEREPRHWSAEDVSLLGDLAALAVDEIEWRRARASRDRAQERLRAAEARFRGLVEQSLAGIFVIQEGLLTYVNPRFAEIFGRDEAELGAGFPVLELIHPDDRVLIAHMMERRAAGEPPGARYTFRGLHGSGGVVHLEARGTRTEMDGRPAVLGVLLDVSDRVRAESERERAVAARERFFAMASHELRTPISAIMLYNDLLLSDVYGGLADTQRDAVARSQAQATHLLELVNDLLDLSKLDAGKMERRLEDVELVALVETTIGGIGPLAVEQGCRLEVHAAERPMVITGDARRIRQILSNLLSNAVKFAPGQPVEVACRVQDAHAVVEVRDHGPGIAPEDRERIFHDFVQLGETEATGTGLGLSIARGLAVALGGRLDVDSTPGGGSTFRLVLPAVPTEA